ncbi:DUF1918 domain-containing protein [Nocardiopsis composta]|uniref:DUF1918 domain-containing protein n=1 Tax=Nocardiopsis composta TaxID=157465 RepID=A0A7W8QH43_9ACTN|nr:DUF1918 domain-containing protein [Nocardiopsis composta]MBB5430145.1 hypothetical protein [Nocardiopsis composta]
MQATVGDRVKINSRVVGMKEQTGEIVEVRGPEGEPPYLVRFEDGHEGLIFPGPDALIVRQPGPVD